MQGINIVGGGAFSATEDAFKAAVVSVARGFVLILGAVFVMSAFFWNDRSMACVCCC